MPFQLSPGVAVVEKDFSSIVPAVSSSVGAFAGSFAWGPVLQPITISSENILVQRFGKPNDSNFTSFFSAANFLSYTNNLLTVRADGTNLKNAVHIKSGGLSTLAINNAGSGYTSTAAAPVVTVAAPDETGGIQATATCTISGGAITAIAVASGGSGYSGTVNITVTRGAGDTTGTGASGVAVLSGGAIASITVTGGSGYTKTPTVAIVGANQSATLGAVTVGTSTITGITIVTSGSGYAAAPTVTIAAPPSGTTATVTVGAPNTAGVKIKNSEDYVNSFSTGQGLFGEFGAKYPGTLGNGLIVSYADNATYATWTYKSQFDSAPGTSTYATSVGSTKDEMHIIVVDGTGVWTGTPGAVLEKFAFVSKAGDAKKPDGTNNFYKDVINSNSQYIWWLDFPQVLSPTTNFGAYATGAVTYTDAQADAKAGFTLAGGVDDFTMTDGQQQEAYALFSNAELYDVSLIIAGKTTAANAKIIADIAQTRADAVAFVSPQSIVDASPIVGNTSTEALAIVAFRNSMNTIHSYAVMDSGYKYQYDRYSDKYRYVPLNADIAGLCARTDYSNDPWWSPGGYNRGQIKNVVRLAHNPDQTNRDTLYKAGINPVVSFPGQGIILYGDKTLQTKPSAFDRINVRRLFIVLEKAIATAAKFQLFEFNDGFTRAQFVNLVEPFLRDVQGRRGITDFRVKCDDTNNTGQVIDSNQFVADIFIKPARSINFITLNFVAARSSANFTEIGG
jgi:phage tail sheath protein FI